MRPSGWEDDDAIFRSGIGAGVHGGERGIMDIIGLIGYYDLVSMTLITMQAEAPNDSVPPLPPLAAR